MVHRKTIVKKTIQIGWCTQLSKMLGIVRELLITRFMGATALSDAFVTAYKIPNSLRRAFAEGALSAAFVPPMVKKIHTHGPQSISGLMSLAFLVFEGLCLAVVYAVAVNAAAVLLFIAPGFSSEQIVLATGFLKILMPFLFFISTSALLAGPLQAVNHFLVPALSPVLLNIVFIITLLFCLTLQLSVDFLCWTVLFGGFLQCCAHIVSFLYYQLSFGKITRSDIHEFGLIFLKFCLCLVSVSVEEFNLFIDTSFASKLPQGSISLIYLANRFMGLPLGIFAVSFSTVLLPHFSRIQLRAPARLSFYILESMKLVLWITVPVALLMSFFSEKIFYTLFLSSKFSVDHVQQASYILSVFLTGLFFFSINKVLLNIYYARHNTFIPACISVISVAINWYCNMLFLQPWGAIGLTFATIISEIVRTFLFLTVLYLRFDLTWYPKSFFSFMYRYLLQLAVLLLPFAIFYYLIMYCIQQYCFGSIHYFLVYSIGFWFWTGPLSLLYMVSLYYFRSWFNVRVFFLE